MKINECTLKALDCTHCTDPVPHWRLNSRGYLLLWSPYTQQSGGQVHHGWSFHTNYETLRQGWSYGHSVDCIEECFGFVAEDMIRAGREDLRCEIKKLIMENDD